MDDSRALLFDFGGTLDADGVPWETRSLEACRQAGGDFEEARFTAAFKASDRDLERTGRVRGMGLTAMAETQLALVAEIDPGLRFDVPRAAAIFASASRATARRNIPMLARLRGTFTLGIVSNFTGNLRECLVELELADLFGVAVDSMIAGVEKPNPAIFTRALDALGVRPQKAWMIGDNPDRDVRAAADLGISTVWIAPAARPLPPTIRPAHRIASLLELEGVLGCAA